MHFHTLCCRMCSFSCGTLLMTKLLCWHKTNFWTIISLQVKIWQHSGSDSLIYSAAGTPEFRCHGYNNKCDANYVCETNMVKRKNDHYCFQMGNKQLLCQSLVVCALIHPPQAPPDMDFVTLYTKSAAYTDNLWGHFSQDNSLWCYCDRITLHKWKLINDKSGNHSHHFVGEDLRALRDKCSIFQLRTKWEMIMNHLIHPHISSLFSVSICVLDMCNMCNRAAEMSLAPFKRWKEESQFVPFKAQTNSRAHWILTKLLQFHVDAHVTVAEILDFWLQPDCILLSVEILYILLRSQ